MTSTVAKDGQPVRWRDGYTSDDRWWASFVLEPTGEVFWAAQVQGSAPPNTEIVATEWGDVGVWRHPNDPSLPGLSVAARHGGLHTWLATVAPSVDAGVVNIVALQPLQRAVIRVGESGAAVYVKVVPPWRTTAVAGRYGTAHRAGLPTPGVLKVDTDLGLIVLEELPGTPLAEHLETGRAVPHCDEVWELIAQLTAVLGTHGDLHDRQLLVDDLGAITGLVDLDDAGEGELVDDLGRLLSHVTVRGVTHPDQRQRIEAWAGDLRRTLEQHVDARELHRREVASRSQLRKLRRTRGEAAIPP